MDNDKINKELLPHKEKCTYCNKPIVAFGNKRRNGNMSKDWVGRTMHKKCWLITKNI